MADIINHPAGNLDGKIKIFALACHLIKGQGGNGYPDIGAGMHPAGSDMAKENFGQTGRSGICFIEIGKPSRILLPFIHEERLDLLGPRRLLTKDKRNDHQRLVIGGPLILKCRVQGVAEAFAQKCRGILLRHQPSNHGLDRRERCRFILPRLATADKLRQYNRHSF